MDALLAVLQAAQADLRQRGIQSLVWIDPAASLAGGHPLHFLAVLTPPVDYARVRDLTRHLSQLLNAAVELVLVDPAHEAIEPYLDPNAIVVL